MKKDICKIAMILLVKGLTIFTLSAAAQPLSPAKNHFLTETDAPWTGIPRLTHTPFRTVASPEADSKEDPGRFTAGPNPGTANPVSPVHFAAPTVFGVSIDGPDAVCPGTILQYCTAVSPGAKYTWSINGDATITGASDEACATVAAELKCDGSFEIRLHLIDAGIDTVLAKTVLVEDKTKPVVICPKDITVSCDEQLPSVDVSAMVITDDCNGTITRTFVSGVVYDKECLHRYKVTRTYKAADACGNEATCTQHVEVRDELSPDMSCPPNITVTCPDQAMEVNTAAVIAYDNCGSVAPILHMGDVFGGKLGVNRYVLIRTYQAEDKCGNTETCTQRIEVFDEQAPEISCPPNLSLSCPGEAPAVDLKSVTASDNCGLPTLLLEHTGDVITNKLCGNRYTLTRTYRATDFAGHTASCSQKIVVNDLTPPTITCPPNMTMSCGDEALTINLNVATVGDNCSSVTKTHVKDEVTNKICDNNFTLVRTFKVEDGCGYTATCTYKIQVLNQSANAIVCPPNLSIECAPEVPPADPANSAVSDYCGKSATQISWLGDLVTNKTCDNRYTISRTYRAMDACGAMGNCVQKIYVDDQTPPALSCPAGITVNCSAQVPAATPDAIPATDHCSSGKLQVLTSEVITTNGCANRYVIARQYKAKDKCGNEGACTQLIVVNDQTPPSISCPAGITVACTGSVPAVNLVGVNASDNCTGSVTKSFGGDIPGNEVCANQYVLSRIYLATDLCGNTGSCVQKITVSDQKPPKVVCPSNIAVFSTHDVPAPNMGSLTVSDENCGGVVNKSLLSDVISNQNCAEKYQLTRTYVAADACGNTATCKQVITVNDIAAPTGKCPAAVTVACADELPCSGTDPNLGTLIKQLQTNFTDNSAMPVSILVDSLFPVQECSAGNNSFGRTVRFLVSDACGNKTPCSVRYSGSCFCTHTQEFWGDPASRINGVTVTNILDSLLKQGWVRVGEMTGCGWAANTAPCILKALPSSGPSIPFNPDSLPSCNSLMKNTLAGQLMALQLNMRYNAAYRGVDLGSVPLAGSCMVDSAQLKALGLPVWSKIQDLLSPVNAYLSANCNDTTYAAGYGDKLNTLLTTLNTFWDNCQNNEPCQQDNFSDTNTGNREQELPGGEPGPDALSLWPNPTTSGLRVDFQSVEAGSRQLRVFDAEGKQVLTMAINVDAGQNTIGLRTNTWKPGLYWLTLTGSTGTQSRRFVVLQP